MVDVERMDGEGWRRVRELRLMALLEAPDAFGRTHREEVDQGSAFWQERLANDESATWLAVIDGVDVGIVSAAEYKGKPGAAGLFSMWVAPQVRGGGVGDDLVQAVIAWARDRRYERLILDVADDNPAAIRLYARHGFEPTGVRGTLPPPRTHITEHERALTL